MNKSLFSSRKKLRAILQISLSNVLLYERKIPNYSLSGEDTEVWSVETDTLTGHRPVGKGEHVVT